VSTVNPFVFFEVFYCHFIVLSVQLHQPFFIIHPFIRMASYSIVAWPRHFIDADETLSDRS
jgi:hypothetical protein